MRNLDYPFEVRTLSHAEGVSLDALVLTFLTEGLGRREHPVQPSSQ